MSLCRPLLVWLLVGNGLIVNSEYVTIYENSLTKYEAFLACGHENLNILSASDIRVNSSIRKELISGLKDGVEAWLGDIANFSSFAAHLGCWAKYNLTKKPYLDNNVQSCSNECKTQFIGLKEGECHCIIRQPEESKKLNASSCNVTCSSLFGETCGGSDAMTLYEMVIEKDLISTLNEYKQCVILKKISDPARIVWTTESCTSHCKPLCTQCNDSSVFTVPQNEQDDVSWKQAQEKCKMQNECPVVNHTTADAANLASYLNPAHQYWTGLFRTFNGIRRTGPHLSNPSSACIFVRKKNPGSLEFESTSCSDKKQYACLGQIKVPTRSSKKTTTNSRKDGTSTEMPTTTTLARKAPITTEVSTTVTPETGTTSDQSFSGQSAFPPGSKGDSSPVWTIVVVTVSAVAALVIVVATTVICRKKLMTKQKADINTAGQGRGNSDHTAGTYIADQANQQNANLYVDNSLLDDSIPSPETDQDYAEIADDEIIDEKSKLKAPLNADYAEITDDGIIDEKSRLSVPLSDKGTGKLSPRKPERRTLKMKQTRTEDEGVSDPQQENTYNVVNETQNLSSDQETCNVYNHLDIRTGKKAEDGLTSEIDNVYDHTGMPSASSAVCKKHVAEESNPYNCLATTDEGVYNHTDARDKMENTENTENTYNTLQRDSET